MKPLVHYIRDQLNIIGQVGGRASVHPINHPDPHGFVSNASFVRTSPIVSRGTEAFETLNTLYAPVGWTREEAEKDINENSKD